MMEDTQENNATSSTEELGNAIAATRMEEYSNVILSDVESKRIDASRGAGYSRRVMLLEPIMLVYAFYVGAIIPISDQYIRAKLTHDYNFTGGNDSKSSSDVGRCSNESSRYENDDIDSMASLWTLYTNIATIVPGVFAMILLGSYSDRGGRKVSTIVPQFGAIVRCVCFLAVIYFDWPLYVITFGAFLEGLSGGVSMVFSAGFSYLSDVTSRNRSFRMTILESCFGLGTVVSQIATGYLIASLGYFYPFLILTTIILLDLVITACFLPETIAKQPDARFWSLGHFQKATNVYLKDDDTGRRWKLLLSLAIAFFTCSVTLGRMDVLIIYLLDAPLCWSSVLIGYFGALYMFLCAPTSVLMTKLTQPRLRDSALLFIGSISAVAYQAVVAFSTTTILTFMAPVAGAASYLVLPMVRSLSSKLVKQEEEGVLFATIAIMTTISMLMGQLVFNNVYSATVYVWAPLTFLIMLATLGFTTFLALVFVIKEKLEMRRCISCDERTHLIS